MFQLFPKAWRGLLRAALCSVLCLSAFASAARAAAMFDAEGDATLLIRGITNLTNPGSLADLTILGDAIVVDQFQNPQLNSEATAEALAELLGANAPNLGVGDSVELSSESSGTAGNNGFSEAFALTNGFISLSNASMTDIFEISFLLEYDLSAAAAVDILGSEAAISLASIDLFTQDFDLLLDEAFVDLTALTGDPFDRVERQFASDNFEFSVTLNPESFDSVGLFVDTAGVAQSTVPEPSTFLLLGAGVAGAFALRRRKQN